MVSFFFFFFLKFWFVCFSLLFFLISIFRYPLPRPHTYTHTVSEILYIYVTVTYLVSSFHSKLVIPLSSNFPNAYMMCVHREGSMWLGSNLAIPFLY